MQGKIKKRIVLIFVLLVLCLLAGAWLLLFEGRGDRAGINSIKAEQSDNAQNADSGKTGSSTYTLISTFGSALPEVSGSAEEVIREWMIADHVYSHRGSAGSAEHSFEAYDATIEAGSHNIEQDIVISGDGTLYVSHDLSAAAMTGVRRAYADMTDAEIDELTTYAGNKILKLSDVFERYGRSVRYVIELKSGDDATVRAFKDTVDNYEMAALVDVQSFEPGVLGKLEDIYPDMPKIQLCRTQGDFEAALGEDYADEICVKSPQMTERNCDAAHEKDKKFSAWTLDSESEIREAVNIGADAYFTNDTPLAMEIERKYRKVKIGRASGAGSGAGSSAGAGVGAAGTTLLFASDYQAEDDFESPRETLQSVVKTAVDDGKVPDMAVLCGDYTNDASLHDYQLSGENSIAEIRDAMREEIPTLANKDMLFVQGNHDAMTESIAASGLHEYDDCLIYVLNTENDFPWKQGKVAGSHDKVRAAAAGMKACFDDLTAKGETRPVFIAGHVPLHYTARTSSRHTTGDNLYSSLVFDVVNEAAESLDIVYLFGHNHSKGWDCYMGGGCVYKGAGDTLLLPVFTDSAVNTDQFEEKTLNFTYLNAGYVGYYMNCAPDEYSSDADSPYRAADEALTCTVCEIYPDRVEISRYDSDGPHVLGASGAANPYKGGIDSGLIDSKYYSTETQSPVTIPRKAASNHKDAGEDLADAA